jgi:hypothetical protein
MIESSGIPFYLYNLAHHRLTERRMYIHCSPVQYAFGVPKRLAAINRMIVKELIPARF